MKTIAYVSLADGKHPAITIDSARAVQYAADTHGTVEELVLRSEAEQAVVYPPDGSTSPFTVIHLGHGVVQMGDCVHDGRLPALWFGTGGRGMGDGPAHPGETIAVVTFANVEGLDVLLDTLRRIRREVFPDADDHSS